jgi:hypothetical protein
MEGTVKAGKGCKTPPLRRLEWIRDRRKAHDDRFDAQVGDANGTFRELVTQLAGETR